MIFYICEVNQFRICTYILDISPNGPLPAPISKHEEEHTENDAGHANMDANHNAAHRALYTPAVTLSFLSCSKENYYCTLM